MKLDSDSPVMTTESLLLSIEDIFIDPSSKRILIDITTFTHEGLLILFKIISIKRRNIDELLIVYVGAKEYSYNEKEEDKWLSKGIGNIRSVIGYPGLNNPSKFNHLIILFGFESERTSKLIETFESNIVSLGFGSEEGAITKEHHRLNFRRHEELMVHFPNCHKFEFSVSDPFETQKKIIEQINKFPDTNTTVAPMNSKISTIGAALATMINVNIQLCYVTANIYNSFYSIADTKFHIFKID